MRYPLQPLLDALGNPNVRDAAARFGVSATSVHHYRDHGLSVRVADRLAISAGLHPALVWERWVDDALSVLDRMFLDGGWRQSWLYAQGMVA